MRGRVWRQDGPNAGSGALFLAYVTFLNANMSRLTSANSASMEKDASTNHDLVDDGYNVGRLVIHPILKR